jgi:hypothetical protein
MTGKIVKKRQEKLRVNCEEKSGKIVEVKVAKMARKL